LRCKLEELDNHQDDMEQYQRKHNLEIHGIPEKRDENLEIIVKNLGQALDVEINYSDIDIVHRLPSKSAIRPIIVKFSSYNEKHELYAARRKLRSLIDAEDRFNGAKTIYINENLTRQRKKLFAEVRKRVKLNRWYGAWTKDGKIFLRKEKEGRNTRIKQEVDLEDLYY